MVSEAKKKRELAKLLSRLKGFRGSGTELITVYIPEGYPLAEISNKLRSEYGQAANIKSKSTKNNVQAALDKIIQYLKIFRQTPENGLAIFCGNISKDPGRPDIELFSLEPHQPLQIQMYRCDSEFQMEPLLMMGKVREKYGLVTVDGKDATIAILEGNVTKIVKRLATTGPSKTHKGGSCIHEDSKVQLADGTIIKIAEVREGDTLLSHSFDSEKPILSKCDAVMKRTSEEAYRVVTKHPRTEIIATKEHRFFVRTEHGVEEKYVDELKPGNLLVHITEIPIEGKNQAIPLKIESRPRFDGQVRELLRQRRKELGLSQEKVAQLIGVSQMVLSHIETGRRKMSETKILPGLLEVYGLDNSTVPQESLVCMPKEFTPEVCQLLGYALGDGTIDNNRIVLYDRDDKMLAHYGGICANAFGLEAVLRKPKPNMFELRIYSKWLRNALVERFPELFARSEERNIPDTILTLPRKCLAAFIRGLFDAEGFVSTRVAIGMRTKHVIEKLRYALLRFGILSSLYWKKTDEKGVWLLEINDALSLERFIKEIGFSHERKQSKLIALRKGADNIRQIPISGRKVLELVKKVGLNTRDFPNINMFFANRRRMSTAVFAKKVLPVLRQQKGLNETQQSIVQYLENIADTEYVSPKIIRIEKIKLNCDFYDLSIPDMENFVVNGLVVHNSAGRYQRYVEELIENYYRRIGEAMDETLFTAGIKKVFVGGPGPVKDNFLKMKNFNYQFQILGVFDIGYVDDYGISELAKKAFDVISEKKALNEKKLLADFMREVAKEGLAVYGAKATMDALEKGKVGTLLMSEKFIAKLLRIRCEKGDEEDVIIEKEEEKEDIRCSNGHNVEFIGEIDLFDQLYDKAEAKGIDVETIASDTSEGQQFLAGFKGIGALLRYK